MILITGATSGIGRQLVEDYTKSGADVVACGRNLEKLAGVKDDCKAHQGKVLTLAFDVTDRAQTTRVLSDFLREQEITVAILNAGVCEYIDDPLHFDAALVERVFAANFFGVVYCLQALLARMPVSSKIAIVDSMARQFPFVRAEAYGASKAAIHYFARSLQADIGQNGVQVITISPGFVKTPLTDKNDFEMPMRVSVEHASLAIRRGIAKGKSHIAFPRLFGGILSLLERLPRGIQNYLATRMKQS
ncbi:SDR family NAD(P)-dependent oxidoreductase [Aliidiomarina halalkaliphila]|uniref:SDR family NAD(P)-dependent oxidoreductase n=1 Tax=Aliidiomarina halalkaliphila TaxID=2593535 RepID=A0A552X487_9GAMM|nr:SDR family NAD(P)-dependent oxidoreductase [Aliidiomarina halalkaliphila]TRW49844.1 SDR family NAD(P)-dependent oxidoreductase [Aliidiomarina halalkaliphila]